MLGFPPGTPAPTKKEVTAQFRIKMRTCIPTTAATTASASTAVFELAEARKILTDAACVAVTPSADGPTTADALLLFPGAGAARSADAGRRRRGHALQGWTTVRADFPYRRAGRRAPDRPPVLLAAVREELAADRTRPVVVGGRSMGGRICSMVAAGADGDPPPETVAGVVPVSYPLHPPGKPDRCASSTSGDSRSRACSSTAPRTRSGRRRS